MRIENIRISGMKHPECLDVVMPTITWEIKTDKMDDLRQSGQLESWKVEVLQNKDKIWESGKRTELLFICKLDEISLIPCTKYTVKIEVRMKNGEILLGESGWNTGFLHTKKWEAKWIGPKREKRQTVNFYDAANQSAKGEKGKVIKDSIKDLYPVTCFKKRLPDISKRVVSAIIYATARGMYEIEIDGQKIGDIELTPEFTPYDKYLQYQAYDVTDCLNEECKKIEVYLADGYYIGRIGMFGVGYEYGDNISFLLQMEITYEDGEKEIIVSDETWRYKETQIRYSDLFIGEKWDFTYKTEQNMKKPLVFQEKNSVLIGQAAEASCILERIPAKKIIKTPRGETVIDFGQVMCGRAYIELDGVEGDTVVLDHQETLDENGNFFFNIPEFNCEQRDIFITSHGKCILSPRFAFHGFRYVRISGYSGELTEQQCHAVTIGSPCDKTMEFSCSDSRLNQLQHNIWWSQKSNFCGIPTDCPQRERAGWTGDIQIYAETACMNADIRAFMRRWLEEMRMEQLPEGEIPVVVPFNKGYRDMQKQYGGATTSAGWGDACVIVPWQLYQAYADIQILEENFSMMEKWITYVQRQADIVDDAENRMAEENENQKYLWNSGFHFGDWLYPSARNEAGVSDAFLSALTSKDLVAPTMYAYSVSTMIKVCKALQKKKEAMYYEDLLRRIKNAYAAVYLQGDGRILPELQGVYVLALKMGLIPEEKRKLTVSHLVRLIKENHYCLDTGFLSVPFLLEVLYENGEKELAYKVLYNETCPSWLYEVKMGATTIWESWDAISITGKPAVTSFNHYAFGCVGSWMYQRILGLKATLPGYRKFEVNPDFQCGLEYAQGKYHSIFGDIEIAWRKLEEQIKVNVKVPLNTKAEINLVHRNKKVSELVGSGEYVYTL